MNVLSTIPLQSMQEFASRAETTGNTGTSLVRRQETQLTTQQETDADTIIPVGEEVLQIGKRVVQQGATRVIRSVVEKPVEQEVELIRRTVVVERRPVTGQSEMHGGGILTEKTVEVTDSIEKPIVSKALRIVEEVVLRQEETRHTEKIRDTVKHDVVRVEQPNRMPTVVGDRDRDHGNNNKQQQHRRHG